MKDVAGDQRPHFMSQVLTGAMFDIIIRLSRHYVEKRGRTVPQAFWDTIQRMQNMAIQPLDLLPPVDVTFSDYALAVLRAEEIANPTDPDDYRGMMLDVFIKRGILDDVGRDRAAQAAPRLRAARAGRVPRRRRRSRARAPTPTASSTTTGRSCSFPPNADVIVADSVHGAEADAPGTPAAEAGAAAIRLAGRRRARGTAVRALRWPGDEPAVRRHAGAEPERGDAGLGAQARLAAGRRQPRRPRQSRRKAPRGERRSSRPLARRIKTGRIGTAIGGERGLLARSIPPLTSRSGRRRASLRAVAAFRNPRRCATRFTEAAHGR